MKNDIIKNKGISFASLYEGSYKTFSDQGIEGIFERKLVEEVLALIEPYKFMDEQFG